MEAEHQGVSAADLAGVLAWLEQEGFGVTSRLPLFAARHWTPGLERRARERYTQGLCNLDEVAVPRWYWRELPELQALRFSLLSLGLPPSLHAPSNSPLAPLLDAGGKPRWRLIRRFSRYVLASRPEVRDDTLTYFGDDTLFLMGGARELMSDLPNGSVRVLDLCCGGGGVGLGLAPFEGELVGVDVNPEAVGLARLSAAAQGLWHYRYLCADAREALQGEYDLIVGNPPTLPPELGGRSTLYATGPSSLLHELLELVLDCLSARGTALLTVFSTARGRGDEAPDELRSELRRALQGRRGHRYTVRRHFPVGQGRWLRHVALQILPQSEKPAQTFRHEARGGFQLPGLGWRREPGGHLTRALQPTC